MLEKRAHGSVEMPAERLARVEQALQDLQAWEDNPVLVRLVGRPANPDFAKLTMLEIIDSVDPCATASDVFASEAVRFARLFAAMRIAALEVEGKYDLPSTTPGSPVSTGRPSPTKKCNSSRG